MPFICKRRSDIPDSILQVKDLWPNKSQYNVPNEPHPQGPRYVDGPINDTLVLRTGAGASLYVQGLTRGLAAYLAVNIEDQAAAAALTAVQANGAAVGIIARMLGGLSLTAADINAVIQAQPGVNAGTTLTAGNSTGSVMDVLRICAGAVFTVPNNVQTQTVGGAFIPNATPNANRFDYTKFKDVLTADSSFYISYAEGNIYGLLRPTFTYRNILGAAIAVYDNTGALMP